MLADVLAACGERNGRHDRRRGARRPLQARATTSSRITCSCSTSSTSAAAATRSMPSASTRDARSTSRRSCTATSSGARRGSRRSRPRPCSSRSTWSARWWPPTPAPRSTTCAPSSRRPSGATTCAVPPRPQPTPLDEDVLSVLSAAVRARTRGRDRVPRAPGRVGRAPRGRAALPARRARRLVLRHLGPHARRRAHVPRRPHSRRRALSTRPSSAAGSVTARVDGALGDHAGTASVWFSAGVARWELEERPDTVALADGAALASVAYGNGALALRRALPLPRRGRAARARAAARAGGGASTRARRARARARHRQRAVSVPQARWLSEAEVAPLLPPPAEAAELAPLASSSALAAGTSSCRRSPPSIPRADAFVNVMPAYSQAGSTPPGVKLVERLPRATASAGCRRSRRVVIVLDSDTGLVRGVLARAALTALPHGRRVGAPASRGSRPPGHVAITGAGVEARTHLWRSTRSGAATSSSGITGRPTWTRCAGLGRTSTCRRSRCAPLRAAPATRADGAAVVITGIPIGAAAAASIRRRSAGTSWRCRSTTRRRSAPSRPTAAALLLADDVAPARQLPRRPTSAGWRELDGPVAAGSPMARRRARPGASSSRTWASARTTSPSGARCSSAPSATASATLVTS